MPVEQVVAFLDAWLQRLENVDAELLDAIERTDELGDAEAARLRQAIEAVRRDFTGGGPS